MIHQLSQQARVAGLQLASLRARRNDLNRAIAALEEFQRLTTGHIRKLSASGGDSANSATRGRNRRYRRKGKLYVMEAAAA